MVKLCSALRNQSLSLPHAKDLEKGGLHIVIHMSDRSLNVQLAKAPANGAAKEAANVRLVPALQHLDGRLTHVPLNDGDLIAGDAPLQVLKVLEPRPLQKSITIKLGKRPGIAMLAINASYAQPSSAIKSAAHSRLLGCKMHPGILTKDKQPDFQPSSNARHSLSKKQRSSFSDY